MREQSFEVTESCLLADSDDEFREGSSDEEVFYRSEVGDGVDLVPGGREEKGVNSSEQRREGGEDEPSDFGKDPDAAKGRQEERSQSPTLVVGTRNMSTRDGDDSHNPILLVNISVENHVRLDVDVVLRIVPGRDRGVEPML